MLPTHNAWLKSLVCPGLVATSVCVLNFFRYQKYYQNQATSKLHCRTSKCEGFQLHLCKCVNWNWVCCVLSAETEGVQARMHGNTFTDTPELSELRPALRHQSIQSVLYSTFTDVVARLELKLAVTPAAHVSVLQRLHLQGPWKTIVSNTTRGIRRFFSRCSRNFAIRTLLRALFWCLFLFVFPDRLANNSHETGQERGKRRKGRERW